MVPRGTTVTCKGISLKIMNVSDYFLTVFGSLFAHTLGSANLDDFLTLPYRILLHSTVPKSFQKNI